MDLLVTSETVMYFECPTVCLKLSQIVSFCTDIFQMSKIVSSFCLKLSQNKQGIKHGNLSGNIQCILSYSKIAHGIYILYLDLLLTGLDWDKGSELGQTG